MSALNLYQLEVQIKNAQATKKSEQITAKAASKNWVNLPDAERSNYEKNCKNIEHVVSMMKDLDEAKDSKKTKTVKSENVSSKEDKKEEVKQPKETASKKVAPPKAEKEQPKEVPKAKIKEEKKSQAAKVEKEEPPTDKTPK